MFFAFTQLGGMRRSECRSFHDPENFLPRRTGDDVGLDLLAPFLVGRYRAELVPRRVEFT